MYVHHDNFILSTYLIMLMMLEIFNCFSLMMSCCKILPSGVTLLVLECGKTNDWAGWAVHVNQPPAKNVPISISISRRFLTVAAFCIVVKEGKKGLLLISS